MADGRAAGAPPRTALVMALTVAVLLAATFLRFSDIDAQSFWNDEGNAYVQATRGFSAIAEHAARDIHPPGYYWLLALWRSAAGESELALRLLSALASVLSVAFTFALGRRLFGPGAGLVAALLVALSSFSIYYGQEARMYALLALWGAAGMWVFTVFVGRPGLRWGLALALVSAAGLWTQYAYAFVLLAQGALMLLWLAGLLRRDGLQAFAYTFGAYVAASLLALALYLPWLPTALDQIAAWPSAGAPTPFVEALGVSLGWLMFGPTYPETSAGSFAVGNLLLVFGLLAAPRQPRGWWRLLVPVVWVVVTLALFLGFHLFRQQNLKLLIPAQIGLALWLARGVWVLWRFARYERPDAGRVFASPGLRAALFRGAAAVGLLWLVYNLALGLGPLRSGEAYQRADYRGIVADLSRTLRPGDAIVLDAPNQEEVFRYYYHGDASVYTLPPGLGGDDDATRAAVESIIDAHSRAFVVFWGEAERDPNRVVETTLDAETFEIGDRWYGDVRLAAYAMPHEMDAGIESGARFGEHITLERYAISDETVLPGDVLQVRLEWTTDTPLNERYKVFVQLLDENGMLVAQRDSEPGGGLALTTTWMPGQTVVDNHALVVPSDLDAAHYLLITGLYQINQPAARLLVDGADSLTLAEIAVEEPLGDE